MRDRVRRLLIPSLIGLELVALALLSCSGTPDSYETLPEIERKWAEPIHVSGLRNAHRVTKDLYRGAQPTAEGMRQLKKMGIKTIVNLRVLHSDRNEIGDLALGYVHIRMNAWHPEDEDVIRFLKVVADPKNLPVYVHCHYGSDRTGMMCAIYRVFICGWSREEAVKEMTEGNFGYHPIWRKLLKYLRGLDVDALKREAGI